jgi:hypothetical protein
MKMSRLTPVAVLLLIASSALAQITGERPVSTPAYAPVTGIRSASIASNGDGFLAVWLNPEGDGLYASRLAADGTVLDPLGIFLAHARTTASVAWTGDRYLVVWNDPYNVVVMGVQITADGRLVAPPRIIRENAQSYGRYLLASNGNVTVLIAGTGYLILDGNANVIEDADRFPARAVYLAPSGEFVLTAGGGTTRLDSAGRVVSRTTRGWGAIIACSSGKCLTAFEVGGGRLRIGPYDSASLTVGPLQEVPEVSNPYYGFDIVPVTGGFLLLTNSVQRLDLDGHPLGPALTLPGTSGGSLAASNGRDLAVLGLGESLTASIVTPATVSQPATVAVGVNAQHDVSIARGGANYLAAWTEKKGTYAGRLSLDGLPLDGRGVLIGTGNSKPTVIFDGASYLVVVRTGELCPSCGPPLNPAQNIVQIDPATGNVLWVSKVPSADLAIGSNGFSRIALWTEESRLVAAFLSPNGSIASAPVFVAAPKADTRFTNLSVAWNGSVWLLMWVDERIHQPGLPGYDSPPATFAIRGARFSSELTPLDTQPITITAPADTTIVQPRLASDGRDFLVAWSANPPFGVQATVVVRRILSTGSPADSEMPLFGGTMQDLVWDGANYDLAYSGGTPSDLAVARLDRSGHPLATLAVSATASDDRSASLLPIGNGTVITAYTRDALEPIYSGVARAFVGTLHPLREHASKPH